MPLPLSFSLRRRARRALRMFGRGLVPACGAARHTPIRYARNASRQCQGLTLWIGSIHPGVQRLNNSRESNELVQDRFAGDNV
jgi:hypothetical protein